MLKWVTVGILSLQATLSLAAEFPKPVTHAAFPSDSFPTILLGRDLFHDPILSGNRSVACAGCHAPKGSAEPVISDLDPPARNAPALYNLGAAEFTTLFHDGRVFRDPTARMGHAMPDGASLERPVSSTLAAQALIALVSPDEMSGAASENEIARLAASGRIRGLNGAWQNLAERVEAIPAYRRRFDALIGPDEPVHITDIASAIAAFIAYEYRATDTPFDAFLAGRTHALTPPQKRGAELFYGKARCAACHSGPFQTDHDVHDAFVQPVSPDSPDSPLPRNRVRTPSLRNVALTAPYGHSGGFATLKDVVLHHPAPVSAKAAAPAPAVLSDAALADLIAFLGALTDPHAAIGRLGAPAQVPSGLPVEKRLLH